MKMKRKIFDEEYKEQFRQMTDEKKDSHIGLETVRNVMEGFDRGHGIDKRRRMIHEVRNDDKQEEREDETCESDSSETQRMKRLQWIRDNRKRPQNYFLKNTWFLVRKMSTAKIEVIDPGNIGIYADFGSDSDDDDWERKQIEKKMKRLEKL